MSVRISPLAPGDAPAFHELRLRALREHPEAFATSYAEERERTLEQAAARLAPSPDRITLGAFHDDRLAGMAALVRPTRAKQRHRAVLTSMYVVPEARGLRLGRALLEQVLEAARAWEVSEVALAVTVGNNPARELYAGAGFITYGIEPRSLYVEGRYFDVEWMNLQLG